MKDYKLKRRNLRVSHTLEVCCFCEVTVYRPDCRMSGDDHFFLKNLKNLGLLPIFKTLFFNLTNFKTLFFNPRTTAPYSDLKLSSKGHTARTRKERDCVDRIVWTGLCGQRHRRALLKVHRAFSIE
jgi:hypothetical protein